jgi:proprotein convertase subtilisin/kexin type 5
LSTCLSSCVTGTYPNVNQCIDCHPACVTCFGGGTSACNSCRKDPNTNISYYLIVGTTICNETCPIGQIAGSNFRCVSCAQPCSACSIATTNCTHCSTINGVTVVYLQSSTCVTVCALGTYPQAGTTNNLCLNCDSSCAACFGPLQTSCTQCKNTTNVTYFKDPLTPTCNTTCPQGYFGSIPTNLCTQCQTGCASCQTNASYCQLCTNMGSIPYYLINNSCVNFCPNGFYPNGNLCSQCHKSCATCTGSLNTDCTSCANATVDGVFTQFYLAIRSTTCNSGCPPGQYISASFPNSCQQCSSLCVTCEGNPDNCTNGQCPFGYFFFNNSCLTTCFPGFYGDRVSWHCLSCNPACSTCFGSGATSCNSCKFDNTTNTTFYLQLGTTICITFCPFGQIPSANNQCVACAPQCAGCSMLQANCTNCSSLNGVFVYLQNGTCSAVCQSGTYAQNGSSSNNNLCLPCNSACHTCYGPLISNCNSCRNITSSGITTVYFKDPLSNICSINCPVGYVGIIT